MGGVDRRVMLRRALSGAVHGVSKMREAVTDVTVELAESMGSSGVVRKPRLPAAPTTRCADLGLLHSLLDGSPLHAHLDVILASARRSVRLSAADGPAAGRSRMGGVPDVTNGFEWPVWEGRRLSFVGQLDLAALPEGSPPMPSDDLLLFFYDTELRPRGYAPSHATAGRALVVDGGLAAPYRGRLLKRRATPYDVQLSGELVLPSPWSGALDSWGLEFDELLAWDDLATRLAEAQGVEAADPAQERAVHRLLGYPDDVADELPVLCEMLARGLAVDEYLAGEGAPEDLQSEARAEWQLLLQLERDDELGTAWLGYESTLYFWIRQTDLRSGDFSHVWALRT